MFLLVLGPQQEILQFLFGDWAEKGMTGDYAVLELTPLRGEKNFKKRPRNRTLVPVREAAGFAPHIDFTSNQLLNIILQSN